MHPDPIGRNPIFGAALFSAFLQFCDLLRRSAWRNAQELHHIRRGRNRPLGRVRAAVTLRQTFVQAQQRSRNPMVPGRICTWLPAARRTDRCSGHRWAHRYRARAPACHQPKCRYAAARCRSDGGLPKPRDGIFTIRGEAHRRVQRVRHGKPGQVVIRERFGDQREFTPGGCARSTVGFRFRVRTARHVLLFRRL